jgi:hypothetical protein
MNHVDGFVAAVRTTATTAWDLADPRLHPDANRCRSLLIGRRSTGA